jgi:hypothetical protein
VDGTEKYVRATIKKIQSSIPLIKNKDHRQELLGADTRLFNPNIKSVPLNVTET